MARWIRFAHDNLTAFGQIDGDQVQVFEGDLFGVNRPTGRVLPLADVQLRYPVQPGKVIAISTTAGARVERGATLLVLEAMKMEHTIVATMDGTLERLVLAVGDRVVEGIELFQIR